MAPTCHCGVTRGTTVTGQLGKTASRILFVGSFVLAGTAALEKFVNLFGFTLTILEGYAPFRLLELAAVALLFVIALQLREIKKASGGGPGG